MVEKVVMAKAAIIDSGNYICDLPDQASVEDATTSFIEQQIQDIALAQLVELSSVHLSTRSVSVQTTCKTSFLPVGIR